jgi:hypothetical protein
MKASWKTGNRRWNPSWTYVLLELASRYTFVTNGVAASGPSDYKQCTKKRLHRYKCNINPWNYIAREDNTIIRWIMRKQWQHLASTDNNSAQYLKIIPVVISTDHSNTQVHSNTRQCHHLASTDNASTQHNAGILYQRTTTAHSILRQGHYSVPTNNASTQHNAIALHQQMMTAHSNYKRCQYLVTTGNARTQH